MKPIPKLMKLFVTHFGENTEVKWKELCPLWEKHKDSVEHICHMQKNPKYKAKHGFYKVFTDDKIPMSETEQVVKLVEIVQKKNSIKQTKLKEDFEFCELEDTEEFTDEFDDINEILRVHSNF